MNAIAIVLVAVVAAGPAASRWRVLSAAERDIPPRLKTGAAFDAELAAAVPAAVWREAEVRTIVRRLLEDRGVAILLDRRLDPNRELSFEVQGQPVLGVLRNLAERIDAELRVVGNTVYIGPRPETDRLRTLIELRSAELRRMTLGLSRERRLALGQRATLHWSDLDEPAAILQRLLKEYQVQTAVGDAIPHDLWAGATLPEASLVEALSLLLVQFGLTFRWTDAAEGIEITPIPERVVIERSYRPRQMTADAAAQRWSQQFSGIHAEASGSTVVVRGRVEQHEAIDALLTGRRSAQRRMETGTSDPLPIERRTFTINQSVTCQALIATLEKSGLRVEYDPKAMQAAGIDLNREFDLSVSKAGAAEFFRAWCRPMGIRYEIDGLTVRLRPE